MIHIGIGSSYQARTLRIWLKKAKLYSFWLS